MRETINYILLFVPLITLIADKNRLPQTPTELAVLAGATLFTAILVGISLSKNHKKISHFRNEIQTIYHNDKLTGLPLRDIFEHDLKQAVEKANQNSTPLHLIYMDIDQLKDINKSRGMAEGDKAIKALADNIKSLMKFRDGTAYRVHGGSFAILLAGLEDQQKVERFISDSIALQASSSKILDDYKSDLSIGSAEIRPNEAPVEFLKRTISAMKKRKAKEAA